MKARTEELFTVRQKDADRKRAATLLMSGSTPFLLLTTAAEPSCGYCFERNAQIFQVTGNYCLRCWQEETHPDV